ncbi:MAG: hypothetical protein DRP22_05345 [Verrucomicrobia bacterium]|nr:MAG: hypothetical protein DRP22_05345 [Verrucomicrobiota bacterium]
MPRGFLSYWSDSPLAGVAGFLNLNWTNLLLWWLPLEVFTDWIHAIDLGVASLLFYLFLRRRRFAPVAAVVGLLAAFWTGTNLYLCYAGHIGKYGLLVFAALYLLAVDIAVERRSAAWGAVSGVAAGGMFLEQPDVAFFFAIFWGGYTLWRLWVSSPGTVVSVWMKILAPLVVVSALMSFRPLWEGYRTAIRGVAAVSQSKEEKWNFVTQWSWPPEECIDFVAPGFMGWRSGEPAGPYWGRMGRSAGWERTHRGFMNFKLENQYLGFGVLLLAVLGVMYGWGRHHGGSNAGPADLRLWSVLAAAALLLSFGKYFPLYRVLFWLPVVSSVRNPNKFLHIFQLAVGVLAAGGVEVWLRARQDDTARLALRRLIWLGAGAAGLLLLAGMWTAVARNEVVTAFLRKGWPEAMARVIAGNLIGALFHGGVVAALMTGLLAVKRGGERLPEMLRPAAAALLIAADALSISGHYIRPMELAPITDNCVGGYLKQKAANCRVALARQDGPYGYLLTFVLPYHSIPAVNIAQMPRMPDDYRRLLEYGGRNPLRIWELCGAGYLVGPREVFAQIAQQPQWRDRIQPEYGFDLIPSDGGVKFVPSPKDARHWVARIADAPGMFSIAATVKEAEEDRILQEMFSAGVRPGRDVVLVEGEGVGVVNQGGAAQLEVVEAAPGHAVVEVDSSRPALLRYATRFDPDWEVTVDGKRTRLLRCDYLFQAAMVPQGTHRVEFRYRPPWWPLALQCLGMALGGVGVAGALLSIRKAT